MMHEYVMLYRHAYRLSLKDDHTYPHLTAKLTEAVDAIYWAARAAGVDWVLLETAKSAEDRLKG